MRLLDTLKSQLETISNQKNLRPSVKGKKPEEPLSQTEIQILSGKSATFITVNYLWQQQHNFSPAYQALFPTFSAILPFDHFWWMCTETQAGLHLAVCAKYILTK